MPLYRINPATLASRRATEQRYAEQPVRVKYLVSCPHPSGQRVSEYGVNQWWCDTLEQAIEQSGKCAGTIQRQTTVKYLPPGKRVHRERIVWEDVAV